jgi:hypothetical protein
LGETLGEKIKQCHGMQIPALQTIFTDNVLLEKTLYEHGLTITIISENQLVCQVEDVELNYVRYNAGEPFYVTISGAKDINKLLKEIECFDNEYRHNVQSFTYNKLIENLSKSNMKIAEETILEDNSILLTIDL